MSYEPRSVLISCGSNIDAEDNLVRAVSRLTSSFDVMRASRVFATRAVAERSMEGFLNAAIEIRSHLTPAELKFGPLRAIEWTLGRRRTADRNAPRPIDLDVAMAGDLVLESEPLGLSIPDPEILTRVHVAVPLADLAPGRLHPGTGAPLRLVADRLVAASPAGALRISDHPDLVQALVASC